MNTTFKSQDRSVKDTSVVEWCEPRVCDIPAVTIGIVTAVYDQTDPKSSKDAEKKILSLAVESSSGPVKAVLSRNTLRVGAGPSNDLVIDDMYVSKFHCCFFRNDGAWYVKDLDSTNGTFVNDEKITVKEITPGMVVRVGLVNLCVLTGRKDVDFPGYSGIISEDPAMKKVFVAKNCSAVQAPSGTDVAYVRSDMSDTANNQSRRFDDIQREVTIRTKAAINVVQMAKSLGFLDRLVNILSGSCGKLLGNATDSPRPGERRKEKWRGQEKVTGSEGHIDTEEDGESSLSEMGDDLWNRFQQKMRRKKRR